MCSLICKAYSHAFTTKNIISAFSKAGIFPFNSQAVREEKLAPSKLLAGPSSLAPSSAVAHSLDELDSFLATKMPQRQEQKRKRKSRHQNIGGKPITESPVFNKIKELPVTKPKKQKCSPKLFKPPFISNSSRLSDPTKILESLANGACSPNMPCPSPVSPRSPSSTIHLLIGQPEQQSPPMSLSPPMTLTPELPKPATQPLLANLDQPGPSHINLFSDEEVEEDDTPVEDNEVCCVCKLFSPKEMRQRKDICFLNWAQCDKCGHWCHLKFCVPQVSVA